jgi:hypothetical protein
MNEASFLSDQHNIERFRPAWLAVRSSAHLHSGQKDKSCLHVFMTLLTHPEFFLKVSLLVTIFRFFRMPGRRSLNIAAAIGRPDATFAHRFAIEVAWCCMGTPL